MRNVKAFSVGDIVRTSFAVYFSNLPAFLPLSLLVLLPSFAVVLVPDSSTLNDPPVLPGPDELQDPEAVFAVLGPIYAVLIREFLVDWLCVFWLHAALAFGVVRHLRGGHAGFVESFVQFVRGVVPVSVVTAIVGLATAIGLFLFVVPGVVLAMILWVALPAAVVERRGLRALERSAELTRGFKGQIFSLALILTLFQLVGVSLAASVSIAITTDSLLVWTMTRAVGVVFAGIWATAVSVTYHDLRLLRDGVDTRTVPRAVD